MSAYPKTMFQTAETVPLSWYPATASDIGSNTKRRASRTDQSSLTSRTSTTRATSFPWVVAVSEHAVDSIHNFASWRDIAPNKGYKSHHEQGLNQIGMFGGNRIDRLDLSDVGDFILVDDDLFEGNGNSKEGRKGLFYVITVFPALFAFVGFSDSITFLSCYDSFLEHLV